MKTKAMALTCILFACAAAAGCSKTSDVNLGGSYRTVADVPPEPITSLDILFVIDTSGSMAPHQKALIDSARDSLFAQLENDLGQLPDLHVGVISTDVAIEDYNIQQCDPNDVVDEGNGVLFPEPERCPAIDHRFLSDVSDGAGGRTRNFEGPIEDAFACMVDLGTQGCGFEQPLEAVRLALSGGERENQGFLRDDAMLLVVFLSDEDDCSAYDTSLFDPESQEMGPLSSFRCFVDGVVCDPDDPSATGPKSGCRPRENSDYIFPVQEYTDFLAGLKVDPTRIMVAGIFGDPEPVEVVESPDGYGAALADICGPQPSCAPPDAGVMSDAGIPSDSGPDGGASPAECSPRGEVHPAIRLSALAESFPARHEFEPICEAHLATSLRKIARTTGAVMDAKPCLLGELADDEPNRAGVQPTCRVFDVRRPRTDHEQRTAIAACSSGGGRAPCYELATEPTCAHTDSGLAVRVTRDEPAPPDNHVIVECL